MSVIDAPVMVYLTEASSGPLAGVLSAIIVAAIGAVAGYFTYQQKKLCFKSRQGNPLIKAERPLASLNNDSRLTALFCTLIRLPAF